MKKTNSLIIFVSLFVLLLTGCQLQKTNDGASNNKPTTTGKASVALQGQIQAIVLEKDGTNLKVVFNNEIPSTSSNGVSTGLSGAAIPQELITGLNQEVIPPEVLTTLSKTGANAIISIEDENILKDCTLSDINVGDSLIITFDETGTITEIGLIFTKNQTTVQ